MSRAITALVLVLLIAAHPLMNLARLLDWSSSLGTTGSVSFVLRAPEIAWAVEVVVAAGIAWQLRPFLAGLLPRPKGARSPGGMQPRLDGFTVRMERPWAVRATLLVALVGALASSVGVFVQAMVEAASGSGAFPVPDSVPVWVPIGILAGLNFLFQGTVMLVVAVARDAREVRRSRRVVELTGRRLRIGGEEILVGPDVELAEEPEDDALRLTEGRRELRVWGDARELRWLGERLAEVRVAGSTDDVPDAIRRAREAMST